MVLACRKAADRVWRLGVAGIAATAVFGCVGSEPPTTPVASDPMSLISLEDQKAVVADGDGEVAPQQTASLAPDGDAGSARLPVERIELTPERREAIAAIRARAEQEKEAGPDDYPNVFEAPSLGETAPKSTAEVQRIEEGLDEDAAATAEAVDEGDPSVYEDRARWLWGLGRTHVRDSEAEIEAAAD